MKKLLSVLLCAAVMLSLTACGDGEDKGAAETKEISAATAEAPTEESSMLGNIEIVDKPEDDDLAWGELEFVD